jgi:hypothetical protein
MRGAMDDHELVRRQRDQGALRRGQARGVEYAAVDVFDLVILPIIAAMIFREHHVLKCRPELLAGDPEQDWRSG